MPPPPPPGQPQGQPSPRPPAFSFHVLPGTGFRATGVPLLQDFTTHLGSQPSPIVPAQPARPGLLPTVQQLPARPVSPGAIMALPGSQSVPVAPPSPIRPGLPPVLSRTPPPSVSRPFSMGQPPILPQQAPPIRVGLSPDIAAGGILLTAGLIVGEIILQRHILGLPPGFEPQPPFETQADRLARQARNQSRAVQDVQLASKAPLIGSRLPNAVNPPPDPAITLPVVP